MQCPRCQFKNREEALFCRSCGASLINDILCPHCEAPNPPDSRFCEKCGQNLQLPKAGPPERYSEPRSYTPQFLTDKILSSRSAIEGERKLVTVFFADVANFTSMSEKIDPEEVHQIMDGCFRILMDEIHRYEGTINQFTGDGIMALFGAPIAHEDHAQRACHAALSIQKSIQAYGDKIKSEMGFEFKLRIGLNSGPVIVGSIGDDLRLDYTAVGDTTNLASRMESHAKPGSILVSEITYKLTRDFFQFEAVGEMSVKGKEKSQKAFQLIKPSTIKTRIGASVAKGLIRFVGREDSMSALNDIYERVHSGFGQVVGVVGEAGVGKSRLLLEFINQLPQPGFTYLEGRCLHYGSSIIYMPILDILKSYFKTKEGDREYVLKKKIKEKVLSLDKELRNTIPAFQELLSLQVDDNEYQKLEPKQRRERTFEAIRDLLIRISQKKPMVLAFEDLHWVDKSTNEFIGYLIGSLAKTRIMLILLYRPEYSHPWGNRSYYNRVSVSQLGADSSTKLVKAILEGGEIVPEIRDLILRKADGNPFFMEEFTHSLIESRAIRKRGHAYVMDGKISDVQIPGTLQGIIAARMDRLEENLKHTMQVASVIGRDFAFRILQIITGMRDELKSTLVDLQGLEFIYKKNIFPELEYIFKHAITQEVAYNSLLVSRRKEIHEKVGKAIEQLYSDKLPEYYEVLAYQYSRSGNLEKAYRYSRLSGDKAAAKYSNWEAYEFYKQAINGLDKSPETEENIRHQIEVCLSAYNIILIIGFPDDSIQMIEKGERLSKSIGDYRSLAYFYCHKGAYYTIKGDTASGMKYMQDFSTEANKLGDIAMVAESTTGLCFSYLALGEYSIIPDLVHNVIYEIEKAEKETDIFFGGFFSYSVLCAYYGYSLGWLGDFTKGKDQLKKALDFSSGINSYSDMALAEYSYGLICFIKGEGNNAVEHMRASINFMEQCQFSLMLGAAWSILGGGYYLLGDIETALNYMKEGLKIHTDKGRKSGSPLHYLLMGMVYFEKEDLVMAQNCAEKAIYLASENCERQYGAVATIWNGRILGKRESPNYDQAAEIIMKGIGSLEALKLKPYTSQGYLFLGEIYQNAGEPEKSLTCLKKAEGMFQEMKMDYWLAKTKCLLMEPKSATGS